MAINNIFKLLNIIILSLTFLLFGGYNYANIKAQDVQLGTTKNPYIITSVTDFENYISLINNGATDTNTGTQYKDAHYRLATDIVLNDMSVTYAEDKIQLAVNTATGVNQYYISGDLSKLSQGIVIYDSQNNQPISIQSVFNTNYYLQSNFGGSIDGYGHAIKGLMLLESYFITNLVNGSLRNIDFQDAVMIRQGETGSALIYNMQGASISNTQISGCVLSSSKNTAGFVSLMTQESSIQNCVNYTTIIGNNIVGGFAGSANDNSLITNSINFGKIQGTGNYVAGIVANNSTEIHNCMNLGDISSSATTNYVGAIACNVGATDQITNCYTTTGKLIGKSTDTSGVVDLGWVSKLSNYSNTNFHSEYPWDFENVWTMQNGKPALKSFAKQSVVAPMEYFTEHYIENIADDNFSLHSTTSAIEYAGSKVDLEIIQIENYEFDASNTQNITSATLTENTTTTLKAYYKLPRFTVTFSAPDCTLESGSITQSIKYGNKITNFPVFTKPGYDITGWECSNGNNIDAPITESGLIFTPILQPITYTITSNTNIGGNVTIQSSAIINQKIEFSVQPNDGYYVKSISILDGQNNAIQYTNNTFIMPSSNVRINVEFALYEYTITYNQSATYDIVLNRNGNILNSGSKVTTLDNITIIVTPKSGYKITDISFSTKNLTFANGVLSNILDDVNITISTELKSATYQVMHWLEDVDQNNTSTSNTRVKVNNIYYLLNSSESVNSQMNTMTQAEAKIFVGMSSLEFEQIYITEGITPLINIYYNRNEFSITKFTYDEGNVQVVNKAKFGHTVNAVVTANLGYMITSINVKNLTTLETTTNTTFTMPASDIEITAIFSTIPYTITYHNVQDVENNNPTTYNVESDDITLSNLTKQGYNFLGWATSADGEPQQNATIPKGSTGNLVYYAIWELSTYSIVVQSSNGGNVDVVSNAKYLSEVTFIVTTNNGYVLDTLSIKDTKSKNVNYSDNKFTMPASDIEITATFSAIPYTITYHNVQDVENNNPTTYNVESNDITLSNLTKQGYNFLGWATSADGEPQQNITIQKGSTGNLDYYAIWELATYSIVVQSSNGGNVDVVSSAKYLSEVTFTVTVNNGYVLDTLSIKDTESNNVNYSDNKFTMPASNVEITATFSAIPYTITYHNVQDVENNNPTTYIVESNDITLSNLTKQGFNFLGWATSAGGEPKLNTIIQKGTTGNLDYYAIWELKNCAIIVQTSIGGNVNIQDSADYLDEVNFTISINNGYTLQSLTIVDTQNNNITYSDNKFVMPESSVRIIANFTTINYNITYSNNDTYNITVTKGSGVLPSGGEFTVLDNLVVTVTPASGYKITNITLSTTKADFINNVISNAYDDITIFVTSEIKQTSYEVIHWVEDLEQSNTAISGDRILEKGIYYNLHTTETIYTVMNTFTTATAKKLTGMSNLHFEQLMLTEVSEKIVKIYYNRNTYAIITPNYTGGNIQVAKNVKYGHTVNAVVTADLGYVVSSINVKNLTTLETTTNTTFTMPASDIEITATFSTIPYTITYHNVQDVENNNPTIYNVASNDITLSNLTKQGYNFLGWATSANGEPKLNAIIQKGTTGNLDYYAIWDFATYSIVVQSSNGGSINVVSSAKYLSEVTFTVTANNGYVLETLTIKDTESNNINYLDNKFTMPASDIEITATFSTIPYTITYHNVQDVENNNPTTYNVESNDITLSNLTKQGYNFLGWATSAGGEPKLNTIIQKGTTGNLDYYAIWDFATYSIVVQSSNGGSIDVVSKAKYLSKVTFTVTTNNGYVLETLTIKDTESYNINYSDNKFTMPASNVEITATFSTIPYTITYHNVQDVENNNPTTYNVESDDITLSNLTKQGYNFLGWATSANGEPKLNATIQKGTTGNLNYYAIWDFATYSIVVRNSNGGSIDVVSKAKYLSEVTFTVTTNNGYVLETLTIKDTESNNINYSDNKFTMPASDIEITATFSTIPYTITYHNVQDVENNNPTIYNVASDDITLSNLTKQGYNFLGWATSANGEPKLNATIQKGSTGNLDYYAIWDFATYSILVHSSNGGNIDVVTNAKYLSEVTFTVTANNGYVLETLTIKDTESYNINYLDNKFTMPASDIEITATFSTIRYTITYHNVQDVENNNPTTYNVESNDITLSNLTKQGYNFLGWATSANGEPKPNATIQKGTTGNLNYYAIWDFATYSIVVRNSNGGSIDVVSKAKYLSEVTFTVTANNGYVLETLTIKDTESNNVNYLDNKFTMPASNVEITATFSTIPYTITYHNVQDVENNNPTTYNVESNDITLSNLTKQGYNFLGWATSANGEPKLNATIQKGTTGNLDYYAIWDIPQFCIHLETIYSNAEDILYSILDAKVVLPTLESTGYTFVGWFYQTNVSNVIIYHGTDNVRATTLSDIRLDKNNSVQSIDVNANMLADYTLVAKWLPNTNTPYIIKHYLQVEGDQYKLHSSVDCFGTTDSTIIPNFLKIPGYIIQPFDNLTISPSGDTILEIYYNKKIYKITFHISNAELISGELYQELTYGESVTLPQVKKLGCEFSPVLWSVKSGNGSYDYVTDDLTIKAEFTPNIYTIKYLDNGQDITSSNSAIRHVYGTTTQIWQPEKEGNTFLYWTLNDTDTIITDALDNTFYSASNIITLNAVWEIITYTITYNGNYDSLDVGDIDDVNIPAPQTKYYDTDITIRNITGRFYGYEFVEWNTSPEGNGLSYNAYSTYADNAELTLYAIWRYVEVTITFDIAMPFQPNIQPITRSYNQVIGELPSVQEVPGYEFLGWYLADRVINAEYIIRFETDQTLTAKWQKLVYTMTIDLNGGTSSTLSQPILIAGSIGDTYNLPNDITRIGWSLIDVQFDNTSYTYENSVITFGYNDTTATLIWSEIIYNINYNSNSVYAQGNMTSTQFAYGEDITLAKNTYTRPGYEFGGWSTLPYGRVPEFYDETTMCMDIENDVTLYAVWYELLDSIEQIVDDDMINKITLVCTNGVNEAIRMSFTRLSKNETEQYNIEGINGAYIVNLDYNQAPYTLNKDCQLKLRLIEDQTFLYKDIYLINDKSKQKLTYTISDGYIIIDLHKLSDGDVLIIADNIGGVVESIIWLLLTVVLIGCVLLGLYFLRKYKLLTKSNKKEIVEINKTIEVKNKKDI